MAATPWELVKDNEIKVTKVDYESFTDESGTHQRAIVQRGRARDIWREGEIIGAGAYGSVSTFTHHKANGKVKIQAVKKVMKAPLSARRVDYRKELDAILKFSGGKVRQKSHILYNSSSMPFNCIKLLTYPSTQTFL